MSKPIHIISLGAGVQSSCMALMAAKGEITPMPTAAIFADTQDEPDEVYRWLDWLEKELPFPVYHVTNGKLSDDVLRMRVTKDGRAYTRTNLPFHTFSQKAGVGMVRQRGCTADFKIKPIIKKQRELGKIKRGQKKVGIISWIGISLDEIQRMKDSRDRWAVNRWPLVDLGMKRHDCLRWMEKNGYQKPPRSACVYCPFHSDAEWSRLKKFDAVAFERAVAGAKAKTDNINSTLWLHKSCKPLDTVDFSTEEERGQINMFNNECEGMCGV